MKRKDSDTVTGANPSVAERLMLHAQTQEEVS